MFEALIIISNYVYAAHNKLWPSCSEQQFI